MKRKKSSIFQDISKALAGLEAGNLGENLSWHDKQTALNGVLGETQVAKPVVSSGKAIHGQSQRHALARKRVVLACDTGISEAALEYAMNIGHRLQARLDVLVPLTMTDIHPAFKAMSQSLSDSGIRYQILRYRASLDRAIIEHAQIHPDIVFVVVSESASEAVMTATGKGGRLDRPVVLVTENRRLRAG